MATTRLQMKRKHVTKCDKITQPNQTKKKIKVRKTPARIVQEKVKVRKVQEKAKARKAQETSTNVEYTKYDAARMVVYNGLTAAEALRATKNPCCRQTLYRHVRKLKEVINGVLEGTLLKEKALENENRGVPLCVTTYVSESVSSPLTMPDCFDEDTADY